MAILILIYFRDRQSELTLGQGKCNLINTQRPPMFECHCLPVMPFSTKGAMAKATGKRQLMATAFICFHTGQLSLSRPCSRLLPPPLLLSGQKSQLNFDGELSRSSNFRAGADSRRAIMGNGGRRLARSASSRSSYSN